MSASTPCSYPGTVAALETLRARGVRLAVCTNKSERFTLPLLEKLGLLQLFDTVISGDTLGPGILAPDPAPIRFMVERAGGGRAIFLGDTSNDIDAARAAGDWRALPCASASSMKPTALARTPSFSYFDDLVPLLENWPN